MADSLPDLERFRLDEPPKATTLCRTNSRPPRHRHGQLFLKGPIPMAWLERAAQLPGKALHVALALWFNAGLKNQACVRISLSGLQRLGALRDSARRGLAALEQAGLVSVKRHVGRKPIVTILSTEPPKDEAIE
jgi:hypothetical protein